MIGVKVHKEVAGYLEYGEVTFFAEIGCHYLAAEQ